MRTPDCRRSRANGLAGGGICGWFLSAFMVVAAAHAGDRPSAARKADPTVLVTGSLIPQKASRLKHGPTTAFPVVILTREQLSQTGRFTLAGAIRSRSP